MYNISFKGRTIIPIVVLFAILCASIFAGKEILNLIPVFCLPAILFVFSFSFVSYSAIKNCINPQSSDFYIFITTLISFVLFGFVSAVVCGFITTLIIFARRMISIKDSHVYTTKNHDTGAIEFMMNKHGFSKTQNICPEILTKIEVVQITNILHLNMLDIIENLLLSRGEYPAVVIVYFKNIPFLDTEALITLKRFVKNSSIHSSIVIVSGTNGMLLEILKQKAEKENRGQIYGYLVPSFDEAIKKTMTKLKK
jgi:MFS superfamily sulfate permease-like transporter